MVNILKKVCYNKAVVYTNSNAIFISIFRHCSLYLTGATFLRWPPFYAFLKYIYLY